MVDELIGLKLPLLKPKAKISDKPNPGNPGGTQYSREQIDEWKKVLAELNKNNGQ